MKDINFFGKLLQLQTMQCFFCGLFKEGFEPPGLSVCPDGEVLSNVTKLALLNHSAETRREIVPFSVQNPGREAPIHSHALQLSGTCGFYHKLITFLYKHYYITPVKFCGCICNTDYEFYYETCI